MLDQVNITVQKKQPTYGEIIVEPLPQGYGLTLGNALRRILLTSLPGMAITAVKISGVSHEYSTAEGVKEDVVAILLNLKKVRFVLNTDQPEQMKISANLKGKKTVTAGDLVVAGPAKVANPDLEIATLTSPKSKFELDGTVEYGSGYMPVEDRKSAGIGMIPLDAVFTPVIRVNYRVEATRVGQITNFDKLTLQVYTDGTIDPDNAVQQASKILSDYFTFLQQPYGAEGRQVAKAKVVTNKIAEDAPIEELDLPTRVTNSLKSAGIDTIGSLLEAPKEKILSLKNMGSKSYTTIEDKLKEKGLAK